MQVSAAVGAFLLGLTLSGQVADQVRSLLPPLRDVFGGIFFVFFGITIDPRDLLPVAVPALILAIVTASTKVGTGVWAARRAGIGPKGQCAPGSRSCRAESSRSSSPGWGSPPAPNRCSARLAAAYVLILAIGGSLAMRYADKIPSPLNRRKTLVPSTT